MTRQACIVAFHVPHKAASMFGYRLLLGLQREFGYKLYSQNTQRRRDRTTHTRLPADLARHARGWGARTEEPRGLLASVNTAVARLSSPSHVFLRGPVRNFTHVMEDPADPDHDLRFVTPESMVTAASYLAICQTRDPLDLVVSQYFSHGWIHVAPSEPHALDMRRRLQAGEFSVYDYALMEFEGTAGFGQDSILSKYRDLKGLKTRLGPDRLLHLRYEEMMQD